MVSNTINNPNTELSPKQKDLLDTMFSHFLNFLKKFPELESPDKIKELVTFLLHESIQSVNFDSSSMISAIHNMCISLNEEYNRKHMPELNDINKGVFFVNMNALMYKKCKTLKLDNIPHETQCFILNLCYSTQDESRKLQG
jgi:hypothetical protein